MTNVTQQIPNYVGGISQQPDELKVPGQVRTAKNVLPDVTHGLLKRPGGRLIGGNLGAFDTADSKWFHYYRDENEQYIGQIQLSDGEIKMWRCCEMTINGTTHAAGSSVTVNYESGQATALKTYLKQTNSGGTITDADLQTLTLNDYTYINNRNKTAAMAATVEPVRPPEAYIALKKVAYANQYSINLFDNLNTTTLTTATRIKVHSSNLNDHSSCPNTATEIFKVGTGDDFQVQLNQVFSFNNLDIGGTDAANFFEDDQSHIYKLTYCPPAWTTNTYYSVGDLVTGKSDNTKIYKATTAGTSTGSTAPSHDSGDAATGGHTWTAVTTNTYTANTDVTDTQIYNGNACIQVVTGSIQVNSSTALTTVTNAWKAHSQYASLPFEWESQTWTSSLASITFNWKTVGDYSNQISRIILHRGSGGTGNQHTIGGNNTVSATDSALKTNVGQIDISTYGWNTAANELGAGRSDLFFRLTNTGQAVPDSTGDNYICRYTTTVDILHGGSGWQVGDQIRVAMKDGSHVIQVEEISTSQVQANLGLIRPSPTSFDTKTTVTAETILGDLRTGILGDSNGGVNTLYEFKDDVNNGYYCRQVGNGIYISRPTSEGVFNISSPSGDLLNVLTDQN